MKIIDSAALKADIEKNNLAGKAVETMSEDELMLLADLLSKHAESDKAPFFEGDNLVIPFAAPRDCRYWELKLKPQEKIDLFLRLGVPEEKLTMYFSPRALDVARGLTNVSGVPVKKKDDA